MRVLVQFVASIAYGKGVVFCQQFHGKLNGQTLLDFIHEQFPKAFANSANPRESYFYKMGIHLKIARRLEMLWTVWELKNLAFLPEV